MKQDHRTIDILEDSHKCITIDILDDLSKWKKYSIYRIPYHIRRKREEAYEPKLVSIGPYHCDNKQLKRMDEHKARSLDTFVSESGKTRSHYVEALRNICEELMAKYQHLHEHRIISEADFIEVMLADGCFLIEVMRALCEKTVGRYNAHDPIYCIGGIGNIWFDLVSDLLLVENQIPIDALVELVKVEGRQVMAREYVCRLSCEFLGLGKELLRTDKHLLDLKRQNFVGRTGEQAVGSGKLGLIRTVRTAMEYHMSGIRFEGVRGARPRMPVTNIEMTFERNTLRLQLPTLSITKLDETVLINLIAYEHLCPGLAPEVSSYVSFMAGLLQTDEDVGLLQSSEVIEADIGGSAEIPRALSRIDRCIVTRQWTDLGTKIDVLNAHWFENRRKKQLNYWLKGFKDVYFKNPWTVTGLIAGVVALALTVDETILANLGYFNRRKN